MGGFAGRTTLGILMLLLIAVATETALLPLDGAGASADAAGCHGASVVRELPGRKTEYSKTYLLSDGSRRCVNFQSPVNYRGADGGWQAIDAELKPRGKGVFATSAAPVEVTVASETAKRKPISVAADGFTVTMDLLGFSEDEKSISGDTVVFNDVARRTDLTYEALGDGLKETITLRASSAPNVFRYRLTHPGLELHQEDNGGWCLYAPGERQPVFIVGQMGACDSSLDEAEEPAWCDDASMSVAPGEDASTITYSVPRSWLKDSGRVYPVKIDPELFTRNPTDIYVSAGHPGTAYGSTDPQNLLCGLVSDDLGRCQTLVKFPQLENTSNVPPGAVITNADFNIRQYWQPSTNHDTTHVYRIGSGSTDWDENETKNSITLVGSTEIGCGLTCASAKYWFIVDCTSVVQGWIDERDSGAVTRNRGFAIRQESDEGSAYARKFRSGEYSDATYRPNLIVDYVPDTTVPTTTVLGADSLWHASAITLRFSAIDNTGGSGVDHIEYKVDDGSWTTGTSLTINAPANHSNDGAHVVSYRAVDKVGNTESSSTVAAKIDTTSPSSAASGLQEDNDSGWRLSDQSVNLSADDGSGSGVAAIYYKLDDGSQTTCLGAFDVSGAGQHTVEYWAVDAAGNVEDCETGYVNIGEAHLSAVPSSVTTSGDWFAEQDANDDGLADAGSDSDAAGGRGSVDLSWQAVTGASGYAVYLYDGYAYRKVGSATSTSWSSSGKGIYPMDSQIAALATDSTADPFQAGSGLELRDDPSALYAKMAQGSVDYRLRSDYRFCVVPYDDTGADPGVVEGEDLVALVALDNRTKHVREVPQHVAYDLGTFAAQEVSAVLDEGTLRLSASDLAIASYGPTAALDRYYSSARTSASLFAPGWRFGFERSLTFTSSSLTTYADEAGDEYVFAASGDEWLSPNGLQATLAYNDSLLGSDTWTLTYADKTVLTFDADGRLIEESDANGNHVDYTWSSGLMTQITAANGQAITLTYSSGQLVSASYATSSAGTRTVGYATAAPWQVTQYSGSSCARTYEYDYDGSARLSDAKLLHYPESGSNARESYSFASGALAEVALPASYEDDVYHPDHASSVAAISYGTRAATVTRYGRVDGASSAIAESWSWNPTITVASHVGQTTSGETVSDFTTTYRYSPDNQVAYEGQATGASTSGRYDTPGRLLASWDEDGNATSYAYEDDDNPYLPTTTTDPRGAVTTDTYDDAGNLTLESKTETSSTSSATAYTYDDGLVTSEQTLLTGSVADGTWSEIDYSDFAACGAPQTTTYQDVQLSSSSSAVDLEEHASYDEFGNLLTQTARHEVGGSETLAVQASYDIAGNQLTSTGAPSGNSASGATTHATYDALGNATASWTTTSGSSLQNDKMASEFDAAGTLTHERTYLYDESAADYVVQQTVTRVYDALTREISSDDSTVAGEDALTLYDARGSETQSWAEGCETSGYTTLASTRSTYDAYGRLTAKWKPGQPAGDAHATYTYYANGMSHLVTSADGEYTCYTYDPCGNTLTETTPTDGGDEAIVKYKYQLGGRLASKVEADGSYTRYTYDCAGRQIQAQLTTCDESDEEYVTKTASTTTYNSLGDVLSETDSDGIVTYHAYDADGNETETTTGASQTTTTTYDADGNVLTTSDPDGSTVTHGYNALGSQTSETHMVSGNAVRSVSTSFDSLGRVTNESEARSGQAVLSRTWSYPDPNTAGETEVATSYGGLTQTQATDSTELETEDVTSIDGATLTRTVDDRDEADNVTGATLSGAAAASWDYGYDDASRLTEQSGSGISSSGAINYVYGDDCSLKASESLALSLSGTVEGSYAYDDCDRLEADTTSVSGGTEVIGVANTARSLLAFGGATTSTISLTSSNTTLTEAISDYDSGTLTSATIDGTATTFTYDASNGWRTSATAAGETTSYAYNGDGRMTSASDADFTASYAYDAAGQRFSAALTVSSQTTATEYLYDDLTLLGLAANQSGGSDPTSWSISYLYDEDDVPYAGVYRSPSGSEATIVFTILTSDRGDVLELLDADGDAFASYAYDPWGNPIASGTTTSATSLVDATLAANIAERQVLRYAGYAYDAETGFYYCSARYYDPATHEFTSKDPADADEEESAYLYCSGEPVGEVDPEGLASYDKNKAKKYAKKWASKNDEKHNNRYPHWGAHDCTNFINQCLHAGGWVFTRPIPKWHDTSYDKERWYCAWRPGNRNHGSGWAYTSSWSTANHWRAFARNNAKRVADRKHPMRAKKGDILQISNSTEPEDMNHSMFCYANPTGRNPLYYQHGSCAKSDARAGLGRARKDHKEATLFAYRVTSCD